MTPTAREIHDEQAVVDPSHRAALDLTIFVSCYDEQDYILRTLDVVRAAVSEAGSLSYEMIVIDDCSKDRSADLVEEYIERHPRERIILVRNKVNHGLAQNYIDGAFIGRGRYYRLICGDDAEPQKTIVAVLREIGKADLIIPYYVDTPGRSIYRRVLSKSFTFLVNLISGYHLHYYNGLAVHLRYNVMRWHPHTRGFGFQAAIICMLLDRGLTYKEVAVESLESRRGRSNALSFTNSLSVVHMLVGLILRRISNCVYRLTR